MTEVKDLSEQVKALAAAVERLNSTVSTLQQQMAPNDEREAKKELVYFLQCSPGIRRVSKFVFFFLDC